MLPIYELYSYFKSGYINHSHNTCNAYATHTTYKTLTTNTHSTKKIEQKIKVDTYLTIQTVEFEPPRLRKVDYLLYHVSTLTLNIRLSFMFIYYSHICAHDLNNIPPIRGLIGGPHQPQAHLYCHMRKLEC